MSDVAALIKDGGFLYLDANVCISLQDGLAKAVLLRRAYNKNVYGLELR